MGKFKSSVCEWRDYNRQNPLLIDYDPDDPNLNITPEMESEIQRTEARLARRAINLMYRKEFDLPEKLKVLQKKLIPALLPFDEVTKKTKRKFDVSTCYVCEKPVGATDSNKCYFCPNVLHLDYGAPVKLLIFPCNKIEKA